MGLYEDEKLMPISKTRPRRRYLSTTMDSGEMKRALDDRNPAPFRAALEQAAGCAATLGTTRWRCLECSKEAVDGTVRLLFTEAPGSHPETVLTHQINRLLEAE